MIFNGRMIADILPEYAPVRRDKCVCEKAREVIGSKIRVAHMAAKKKVSNVARTCVVHMHMSIVERSQKKLLWKVQSVFALYFSHEISQTGMLT